MKLINLGCGNHFHKDWVNMDFEHPAPSVISHNLLKGIPFPDSYFEVVYHSHVLEHFSKDDGISFIKESWRVLKPNGIIRICIPNLEEIVKGYIQEMQKALNGDESAKANYEWIMLELYDQTVRDHSGGAMREYLERKFISNEQFVYGRIGNEGKLIRDAYLTSINTLSSKRTMFSHIKNLLKYKWKYILLNKEEKKWLAIGKFRCGGEIHQWMYDRYSLSVLLQSVGFAGVEIKTAFESNIPDWNNYQLDSMNGVVRKPDSLFIEAKKP